MSFPAAHSAQPHPERPEAGATDATTTSRPQDVALPATDATQPAGETVSPTRDNPSVATQVDPLEDHDGAALDLRRIAWSVTTLGFLIAVVVLILRGDAGYAGVTLAVAVAAAINLL